MKGKIHPYTRRIPKRENLTRNMVFYKHTVNCNFCLETSYALLDEQIKYSKTSMACSKSRLPAMTYDRCSLRKD